MSLLRALGFLSRIPTPSQAYDDARAHGTANDAGLFALAGAIIALPGAIIIWLGDGSAIAVVLAIAATIVITGALHEDGVADCADGFYGSHEKARRLAIMKDSTIGTYGILVLITVLTLQALSLVQIGTLTPIAAATCFVASAALSRALMVGHWWSLPNARNAGTAHHAGQPDDLVAVTAFTVGIVLFLLLAASAVNVLGALAGAVIGLAVAAGCGRLAHTKIGGHTGDTIGACQQLTHTATLITLAMSV